LGFLSHEYNILPKAGSSLGKNHSEKAKMSTSHKGKKLSEETKNKISSALKGRKFSDKTLAKMSASQKRS
jgi:hypothetical protein